MAVELFKWGDAASRMQALAHGLGIIAVAFLVGALFLPLLGIQLIDPFYPIYVEGELTSRGTLLLTAIQFIGFIGVVVGYVRWAESDIIQISMPSLRDLGWIVGGFVALYATASVFAWAITILGLDVATNAAIETGQGNPQYFLFMVPISLLFIGPGEELLFRGVVQGLFRRAYGIIPGIVIASILFGGVHYLALVGEGQLGYIAIATGLGLVLGTVYELSNNIVVPAVIHGLWNALLFFVQWFVATNPDAVSIVAFLK